MKKLELFIHTSKTHQSTDGDLWIRDFIKQLKKSFESFNVDLYSVITEEQTFFENFGGIDFYCYLPIVDRVFLESEDDIKIFSKINEQISNNTKTRAFAFTLIKEVLPANYAEFQPFYNFFNQGSYSTHKSRNQHEKRLPGNNNEQSFQHHIINIAKELNYQILKLSGSAGSSPGIYMCTTTDDLKNPIDSLCNFLLNKGISVIAPQKPGNMPQDFASKKIRRQIENCYLSIHPVGKTPIDKSYYLNNGKPLCELEYEVSIELENKLKKKKHTDKKYNRIIWIPQPLSPASYEGRMIERFKKSQTENTTFLSCSFDELKNIILTIHKNQKEHLTDSIEEQNKSILKQKVKKKPGSDSVYCIYEESYINELHNLKTVLEKNEMELFTHEDIANEPDYMEIHDFLLQECCGIIFLTSSWNSSWFKCNQNEIRKVLSVSNNKNLKFASIISREIEQLPAELEERYILYHLRGKLTQDILTPLLTSKSTLNKPNYFQKKT